MVDLQWYNQRMLLRLHSQSTSLPGSKRSIYVWPFNVEHMSVLDWQRIVETRVTVEHKLETYLEYGRARLKHTSNTEKNRGARVIFWPWSTVFEECFDRAQEMVRPYSRYVLTVLEVYFDHARGMCWLFSRFASTVLQVCFDRDRGMFQPSVKIKFKRGRERSKHASNTVKNCQNLCLGYSFSIYLFCSMLLYSAYTERKSTRVEMLSWCFDMLVLDRKRIAKTGLGSSTNWKCTAITVELVRNIPHTPSSTVETNLKHGRAGSRYTSSNIEHVRNVPRARSKHISSTVKHSQKHTSNTVEVEPGQNIPRARLSIVIIYLEHGRERSKHASNRVENCQKNLEHGRAWSKHTSNMIKHVRSKPQARSIIEKIYLEHGRNIPLFGRDGRNIKWAPRPGWRLFDNLYCSLQKTSFLKKNLETPWMTIPKRAIIFQILVKDREQG